MQDIGRERETKLELRVLSANVFERGWTKERGDGERERERARERQTKYLLVTPSFVVEPFCLF